MVSLWQWRWRQDRFALILANALEAIDEMARRDVVTRYRSLSNALVRMAVAA
jgi:hypothetical protein